jgi:acyl-CoA thioester hydrolase
MAEWTETFKGVVPETEYDPASHMNTEAYVSRFDQATWFLLARIGLTPKTVQQSGRRIAVLRQSFQFVRELQGTELISIQSGFVAVGRKHLRFVHRMLDVETDLLLASAECTAVQASLSSGKSVELDDTARVMAQDLLVTDINDAGRIDMDARV